LTWLVDDLSPVAITWLLVLSGNQVAEVAGTLTARSAAALFGFTSPLLAVKLKVALCARMDKVHVSLLESIVSVCAPALMI
jgi:hypothetical protein